MFRKIDIDAIAKHLKGLGADEFEKIKALAVLAKSAIRN